MILAAELVRSAACRVGDRLPVSTEVELDSVLMEDSVAASPVVWLVEGERPATSRSVAPFAAPAPKTVAGRAGAKPTSRWAEAVVADGAEVASTSPGSVPWLAGK